MQTNEEVMKRWGDAAPFWEKHRHLIRQMFAPVTQAVISDGAIGSGDSVLDVATGPGEPALTIASLVGPEGKVVGIDPVEDMVAAARREANRLGLTNAQFEVGTTDHLPYPDDTFDAVVSRFGVMFFASPIDGLREMLRVLKPGRILTLAVWRPAEINPYFYTLSQIVARHVVSPPPAPDAPDAFRFASPGKLRDVLDRAGATALSERTLQFKIEAPISPEELWILRSEMSDTLREKFAKLSTEQLGKIKAEALAAFREYSTERGMSFPAEVLIVSGSKGNPK